MSDAATGWTDDRVELLAKLWGEGLSASQIAAALGGGVTRNAVIGKVHRLGLSGRAKAVVPAAQRPSKPRVISQTAEVGEIAHTPARLPHGPSVPVADTRWASEPDSVSGQLVSILDLRDSMCKWPIGDPAKSDFGFCGGKAVSGLPYCGQHCRMAYQPVADRKRLRA